MLPPEGGSSQIGALAASQETWPEVARHGRKPVRQNRGGTPTGERIPQDARPCQLHGRLEQASAGVPLPFFFVARMKRSEIREQRASVTIVPGLRSAPFGLRLRVNQSRAACAARD